MPGWWRGRGHSRQGELQSTLTDAVDANLAAMPQRQEAGGLIGRQMLVL